MIRKVLLINTPRISMEELNKSIGVRQDREVYPPLGLLYLSSIIKAEIENIDVCVLDLHFESVKSIRLNKEVCWDTLCEAKIKEFNPDLIGISVLFGGSLEYAKGICQKIKGHYPDIPLVSGGIHVTGIAGEKNQLEFCDFISLYESEYHIVGLIKYLNGEKNELRGITVKNDAYLREGTKILKDIERPAHLDDLPIPDYGAIDLQNYYKFGVLSASQTITPDTPIASMLTTRGCVAHCKFCSVRSFMGFGVRSHSPERVLEEIDLLYNKFGIRHIDLVDDDFTHNKKRAIKIFEGLIQRKYPLTWSIGNGVRLGTLDDEMLDKMVQSGCTYFSLGIETADPKILKEMRKPLTLKILRDKVQLLRKHPQIYYRANFMVGFPGETKEQMNETFALAREIEFDWSLFSICKPLPNTDLYREMLKMFPDDEDAVMSSDAIDYKFNTSKGMFGDGAGQESVFDKIYTSNLEINFKDNVNLAGRNIERAVDDFEKVIKIANKHAFAWNCLAKGYKALHREEDSRAAVGKTAEIIKESDYWRDKFKELDFKIEP